MARRGSWKRNRLPLVILAILSYNLTPPATALPGEEGHEAAGPGGGGGRSTSHKLLTRAKERLKPPRLVRRGTSTRAFYPVTEVQAVEGQEVTLPCLADSPDGGGGSGRSVDFFFSSIPKGSPIPIYQVNNSGGSREQHWAVRGYDRRALVESNPTRLVLSGITMKDQGVYGCRVRRSSSSTPIISYIALTVVVPPTSIKIYADLDPDTAVTGNVGPYDLGEMVTFSCRVTDGRPIPTVTWWEGSRVLEDTHLIPHTNLSGFSTTTSDVTVGPLTRLDLHRKLTCRASNSHLHEALEASVTLDLKYPPSSVRIVGEKDGKLSLRAGRKQEVVCEVMDGRPAPDVTLKLGEDVLPSHKTVKQETLLKHRRTTHAAVLEPTEDLSGSEVTCLADSPLLLQQASVLLDVTYRPRVKLVIGDNLEPHKVNENDTFSFHCKVSANPEAVNVSWSFNGEELKSNASAGISMEGPTLSLMSLGKSSSGNYRCSATNTEGTGVSKPQYLRVRTKPEAVTSCNATSSNPGEGKAVNLEVKCVAEPAMDASKYFRLKAENLNTGVVKEKTNLLKPVFTITGLTEGKYNLSVTAGNSLGKSPPYTFTHTVCVPPATSGASSISPTPPLLSFSLSTAFSSPISPYSTNSLSFKTPRPHSSSVSHHSSPTSSWSPWRSHWAVFILVMVVMAAIHIGCLIPQLIVTFFIYKIEERRPSPLRQRVSSPRFRRRKSRNSNRELIRAHRLSEPPMQLPTITISPPASAPCTPLTSRKGSLTLNELEGYSIIGAKRAPHASVDSMELSSLCLSVQNEQLDTCSIQDDTVQNGHPRNGTMLPPPSKNGWVPTNEPFLNSNFQDAFLQYNFIEKDSLKRDLMKRPRSRPSSPNFLTVHTPVRKSLKEPSYKA